MGRRGRQLTKEDLLERLTVSLRKDQLDVKPDGSVPMSNQSVGLAMAFAERQGVTYDEVIEWCNENVLPETDPRQSALVRATVEQRLFDPTEDDPKAHLRAIALHYAERLRLDSVSVSGSDDGVITVTIVGTEDPCARR
jgi:hypothetical protein